VAAAVKKVLVDLEPSFPRGLKYSIAFDTTDFIEAGTEEVILSLIIAIALVILIIYLFLQDWRSTLIPAVAIPAMRSTSEKCVFIISANESATKFLTSGNDKTVRLSQ
jgi:multidrug efflux pump subunit AcrB